MAQNKRRNKKQKSWSMYPSLHDDVVSATQPNDLGVSFYDRDDESGHIFSYDTNVMGSFRCRNDRCTQGGWGSRRVAVRIRMYPGRRYNAKVFHQRCSSCDKVAALVLDDGSYVDRLAYRLKKWCGVRMEGGGEGRRYGRRTGGPHQADRCEGCRAGHCPAGAGTE
ncbi:hypothetical protein GMORB2_7287 [Geosmithia morbida]|uniref:3CxxC-type domain-containing protein n=1 Tax=Geosmithia morbida TaxID=1094350 RepID=A0A9P4YT38_9HYPO|nr:uncharacterized protein GMORB2_7287 [Geosmithia morbida]KAF4122295.1 hypothetical protein GMORB2_7287 [Geosmithia morbida]